MTRILLIVLLCVGCGADPDVGVIGRHCDGHRDCNMIEGGFCNKDRWCTKYCSAAADCPSDAVCRDFTYYWLCRPSL